MFSTSSLFGSNHISVTLNAYRSCTKVQSLKFPAVFFLDLKLKYYSYSIVFIIKGLWIIIAGGLFCFLWVPVCLLNFNNSTYPYNQHLFMKSIPNLHLMSLNLQSLHHRRPCYRQANSIVVFKYKNSGVNIFRFFYLGARR